MDVIARTPAQLAAALKSFRARRGLTQTDVGARVGIRQSTVSAVENQAERASVETLYKILSALNLELVVRGKERTGATPRAREW